MPDRYRDMKDIVPPTATVTQRCAVASEMIGNDLLLSGFVEQEESSIMESQRKESSEWTNEKHSLYLKSIEASFVDQLYNSSDTQSWQTQNNCSLDSIGARKVGTKSRIPSGQFKVLQGGFWSKKNFRRENSQLNNADRSHLSPGNPWIQHFTNGSRQGAVVLPSHQERPSATVTSLQYHVSDSQLCHQASSCSNTEVIDQNFVEEDVAIEKENRPCSRKRTRTSVVAHSSNDQVVPFGTFPATQIADSYISPKK